MTSYHANAPPVRLLFPANVKKVHFLLNIYANVCFFAFIIINLIIKRLIESLFD